MGFISLMNTGLPSAQHYEDRDMVTRGVKKVLPHAVIRPLYREGVHYDITPAEPS